ncbi:MAG: hypothetical protein WBX01_04205 [Nitrososphaeraceae archaeon]
MASTGMRIGIGTLLGFKGWGFVYNASKKGYLQSPGLCQNQGFKLHVYNSRMQGIDEYLTFRVVLHARNYNPGTLRDLELFDTTARSADKPNPLREIETLMYRILNRLEVKSSEVMRSHGLCKFTI